MMMCSTGRLPVSRRIIVVGVHLSKYRIVLIASLKMVCSLPFTSLVSFQLSHAYVRIGIMVVLTICHTGLIFMPLNSLFPASASMRVIAPLTFFEISAI